MQEFEEKLHDLINRGYEVRLFKEERNYPITGSYIAYCVSIIKDNKEFCNHSSRYSNEDAFRIVYNHVQQLEEFNKEHLS